jgi:hypothetical protein
MGPCQQGQLWVDNTPPNQEINGLCDVVRSQNRIRNDEDATVNNVGRLVPSVRASVGTSDSRWGLESVAESVPAALL